jgi:cellulose synthase/poly-beta-1,6-N-acetylglucosamine synthase-like glycosyltransferase
MSRRERQAAAGILIGLLAVLAVLDLRYGPRALYSGALTLGWALWWALPSFARSLLSWAGGLLARFPTDLFVFVPVGAVVVLLVYVYLVRVGLAQLPIRDTDGARLRPIRSTDLSDSRAFYEPHSVGPEVPSTSESNGANRSSSAATAAEPSASVAPSSTPGGWASSSAETGSGPVGGGAGAGIGASVPAGATMTVWTSLGRTTLPNDLPPPGPASKPPPTSRFGLQMLVSFVAVTATLILTRNYWLSWYDRLVEAIASVFYSRTALPSPYAFPIGSHALSDYILLMYLSLMLTWGFASGLFWSGRFSRRQRLIAYEILAFYLGTEALIDSVAFSVTNGFVASGFLVVRGVTGGLFSLLLLFDSFTLPRPVSVEPRFRPRGHTVATFVGLGILSLLIAGGILYLLWGELSSHGVTVPFAVLLLEPLLTVVVFDMLGSALYHRELRARPVPPLEEYHPPVSIIIPAYNEEKSIAATIRAADLASRLYPGPTEIVVGNDGSTDRTSEVAREEMGRLQHASGLVVDLPHGGKSNALNGALRVAQGEILIRVDADTRISEEYGFGAIIPHFADPEVGAIQGLILPLQREGWTRKLRLLEICWNHLFLRRGLMATRATQVVDGAFCAFRRKDVLEAGGWVYWNGEDNEITLRLYRLGFLTRYEPGAVAFEDVPATLRSLEKQRVRWNRGGVYAHRRHFGALKAGSFEFGGIAVLVWVLMFMKSGMRYFVYVYALLITLLAGVSTLFTVAFIVLALLTLRGTVIAYYIARLGYWRDLFWIPLWPIGSAIKQAFAVEAFGTMVPGHGGPEFSE